MSDGEVAPRGLGEPGPGAHIPGVRKADRATGSPRRACLALPPILPPAVRLSQPSHPGSTPASMRATSAGIGGISGARRHERAGARCHAGVGAGFGSH